MSSKQLCFFLCALVAALLSGAAVPVLAASGGAGEAARRLARELPADASQLKALREPAATTRSQVAIALDELRQMGVPADLDPHYLPALVATGRAFVAASGRDPLTGTVINPEYTGLEAELATSEARLDRSAGDARTVTAGIRQLERRLRHARRHVRQLERRLRSTGARARPGP
jgi:hypothetical protein